MSNEKIVICWTGFKLKGIEVWRDLTFQPKFMKKKYELFCISVFSDGFFHLIFKLSKKQNTDQSPDVT